jgi:RHS repeat-associated protein
MPFLSVCVASLLRLVLLGMTPADALAQSTVDPATGSFSYDHTDLQIPCFGLPFEFKRHYNSQNANNATSPIGYGWTHSYNIRLTLTSSNGTAVITYADGKQESYLTNGAGGFMGGAGVFNSLTASGGTYTLTTKAQRKYVFDAQGWLTSIVDRNGNTLTMAYSGSNLTSVTDPAGRAISFSYNSIGYLTRFTDPANRFAQFSYDANTNLSSFTDFNGRATHFTYDANHRITQAMDSLGNAFATPVYDGTGAVSSLAGAFGQTTLFGYNFATGITTITDPKGNVSTNHYDSQLRLVETDDNLGARQSFSYNINNEETRMVDKNGNATLFSYDAAGNVAKITDAQENNTLFSHDSQNNLTARTDTKGDTTSFGYDTQGNLTAITNALGGSVSMSYNTLGLHTRTRDALGRTTTFSYDAVANLAKFTDPNGRDVDFLNDVLGNRLSTTDPKGNTTSYVRDTLNRLVNITNPAGGVVQFTYNSGGNLDSRTDPKGNTTTYLYNNSGQYGLLSKISYPTGPSVMFSYDVNGNRTTVTDGLGRTTYSYDTLNRVTNVNDAYDESVGYAYDANGNRTAIIYPGNKTVHYVYDTLNRLTQVHDWLGNTTAYTYDSIGQLTSTTNANGTAATYQYNIGGFLTSLKNSAVSPAIISSHQYSMDVAGNQVHVSQTMPLPTKIDGGDVTNAYDNDNRLITSGGHAQNFDADGNLISAGGTNLFTYDYENRLTQAIVAGTTNVYLYDGLGNRMSASRNGVVTRYILDRNSRSAPVLGETDAAGNILCYYIYGRGLVSRIDAGGGVRYYHFDSQGDTLALSDATGKMVEAYAYDPFGKPGIQIGSTNRFRFRGQHGAVDEGNGLVYFHAHYYATEAGRYINQAEMAVVDGNSQSLNKYIFALDDPINVSSPAPAAGPPDPDVGADKDSWNSVSGGNGSESMSQEVVQ